MAQLGIDLASVDNNGTPDWKSAQALGHLRFVGLRAIEGLTPDPWYPTYRTQLDAIGLPNFPYFLLTPNLSTPEAQARKALEVVGTLNNHYFPLVIDVEGSRRGLTAEQWYLWIVRAARVVQSELGVPPLIYTSRVYWIDPDGLNNLPAPELANCLGWWKYYPWPVHSPAQYDPAQVDQLSAPPAPPPFGNAWTLQQYQGDAIHYPGFRSTVDMDRVHVTRQGDFGDTVKAIQKRLPAIAVDGIFGPATATAVKTFQAERTITADGVVGLDTWQQLAWVSPR